MLTAGSFVRTLVACTALVSVSSAADPTLIGLGDLPGGSSFSTALGMSADGTVICGYSSSATGDQAFRWTAAGGMVGLGDLPGGGTQSHARAISADGTTIVGDAESANGVEAFRWTAATGMVGLGDLSGGSFHSIARGVSANGSVIAGEGRSTLSGPSATEAFRWTEATGMQGLGDLPGSSFSSVATGVSANGLRICGYGTSTASGPTGAELCLWEQGQALVPFGDEPEGNFDSRAFAIDSAGVSMTGTTSTVFGTLAARAAKNFTGDKYSTSYVLDLPGGLWFGEGLAITRTALPSMEVIVGRSLSANGMRPFMWTTNAGTQNLESMLTTVGASLGGWTLECATALSADAKTIAGYGTNPSGQQEAWVAFLGNVWTDVGGGVAGVNGVPKLTGEGVALLNHGHVLKLTGGKPAAVPITIAGLSALNAPFKGGVLVPSPLLMVTGAPLNAAGAWTPMGFTWTPQPSGLSLWVQVWIQDAAAVKGWSASNGIKATAP